MRKDLQGDRRAGKHLPPRSDLVAGSAAADKERSLSSWLLPSQVTEVGMHLQILERQITSVSVSKVELWH